MALDAATACPVLHERQAKPKITLLQDIDKLQVQCLSSSQCRTCLGIWRVFALSCS